MIKTYCTERGLCCDSCQEDVNMHGCWNCRKQFYDGDEMYCISKSQTDCEHYHLDCMPEHFCMNTDTCKGD
jgi:hypothetical protein